MATIGRSVQCGKQGDNSNLVNPKGNKGEDTFWPDLVLVLDIVFC